MIHRGHLGSLLLLGLLAIPLSSRHGEFELFSQETTAASGPLDSAAWDALRKGIDDGDAQHRKTAIAAIGTIGPEPEAVKLVVRGLQDKDALVRQIAAATLGEMGAHDAIPHLKASLDDNNPEVSFTAAKALWDLGDTSSRDIIQAVMSGERSNKPGQLHTAIDEAKHKLRPSEVAFMGMKEDSSAFGRAAAAAILGKDPDPYSLELLEWGLSDKNWAVRVAVARALGERGNQQTVVKLSPLLSDDHHAVRYMSAASMVKLSLKKPPQSGS